MQPNCWGVRASPTIRQMVISQPRQQDGKKKNGRKDGIHLQSSGDGEKTFVFEERERERNTVMEKNIRFLRNTKAHGRLSLTQVRTDMRQKRHGERVKEAKKTKTNKQSLWPKAALSALVFILGSLLSVWRDELFMAQECVGTTVQLLMKQSSGAARLGNHRHNVAGE